MLSIDNEEVRSKQVNRLKQVRASRNDAEVAAALKVLTELAEKLGEGVDSSKAEQNLVNFLLRYFVLGKNRQLNLNRIDVNVPEDRKI